MSEKSSIEWTDATWNPGSRLHEDQPRLQTLLRRDVRRAVPRRARPSVRARLRSEADSREAGRAAEVGAAEDDLRQFDERPVSRRTCPTEYIEQVARVMAMAELAHVPGAHQAGGPPARDCSARSWRFAAELDHIWWGVSVEDKKYGVPRIADLRQRTGRDAVPVGRTAPRRSWRDRSRRHRLGDRRRRERRRRAADGRIVGHRICASSAATLTCRSSSSSGAACKSPSTDDFCKARLMTRCPLSLTILCRTSARD